MIDWCFEDRDRLLSQAACGPGPDCVSFTKRPGVVRIVNVTSKEVIAEARVATAEMYHIAVSPDGRYLAGAGMDGAVRLIDLQQGGAVTTLQAFEKGVSKLQFDRNGRHLLTLGDDGDRASLRPKLWNMETRQMECEFRHPKGVRAASVSADGRFVAGSRGDEVLRLWEVGDNEPLGHLCSGSRTESLHRGHPSLVAAPGETPLWWRRAAC